MTDKELRILDEMLTNLEIWSTWNKTFANEMIGICSKMRNLLTDRKTENCSEFPNNSTRSKMEQVETMSCAECKHRPIGAEICEEPCHYEPQTDWHYDEQDATWYPYKHEDEPQTNADQHVQHVGSVESVEPTWTKEEHEAFYTFLWNVINPNEMQDYIEMFETKDEPQTDCAWK